MRAALHQDTNLTANGTALPVTTVGGHSASRSPGGPESREKVERDQGITHTGTPSRRPMSNSAMSSCDVQKWMKNPGQGLFRGHDGTRTRDLHRVMAGGHSTLVSGDDYLVVLLPPV